VQNDSYVTLSYKIKHNHNIRDFLVGYKHLLQTTIDIIWDNIKWAERKQRNFYVIKQGKRNMRRYYYVKRLIPIIPKSREFKRELRNSLLGNWSFASHYVDSAIKTAYSIINSWRKNYLKGRRKKRKPEVKRYFVRVKETLYAYRNGKIKITIKPRELYLEFDLSKAWFKRRVEGCGLGELILKENELVITFRKPIKERKVVECIGWDLNKYSLDGYSPRYGWIKISLEELYHIHRVHEIKRKKAQSIASRKHSVKPIVSKHGKRERNRSKDFIHKLTTQLTRTFPNAIHGFENLEKQGMYSKSRKHNRDVAKQNWKQIIQYTNYKSTIKLVDPKNTSSTCPMCGEKLIKLRKGQVVKCKRCGLTLDRQLCGAINIYLKMCGFPQNPSTFFRLVSRPLMRLMKRRRRCLMRVLGGVTTKGGKGNDMSLMNPRGELSLMNPKVYIGLPIPM